MDRICFTALFCAASIFSCCPLTAQPSKSFVITDAGAVGDSQTINTSAIQKTIDRCAAANGGVVVVPKGTFITGAIFLKQGCNLSVEKEGVLKGSVDPGDYPQVNTRWEGVDKRWTAAYIASASAPAAGRRIERTAAHLYRKAEAHGHPELP